jgi:hypothetical protein
MIFLEFKYIGIFFYPPTKFGVPEITLNTENKSPSQVTDEILSTIFNKK